MTNNQEVLTAVPVESNYGYHIDVPDLEDINDKMLSCYYLRRTVKILCGIDIFFGLLYSIYSPLFIIPTIIAFFGYYGASHYKKNIVLIYLIYITLNWIAKLTFFIIGAVQSYDTGAPPPVAWAWIFLLLSTGIEIWISRIVYKYWRSLKELPILELSRLKDSKITVYRFVYW